MAGKVTSFGAGAPRSMMDTQKSVMRISPKNSQGNPTSIPGPGIPTYDDQPKGIVTLDPSIDATGLSCGVKGVQGQSGAVTITASYTNPDNTVATGEQVFNQSVDPTELDVASFDVTTDEPVAQ